MVDRAWQPASPPPPIWDRDRSFTTRPGSDNSVRVWPVERPQKPPSGRSPLSSGLLAGKHGQRALTATYNMRRFSETVVLIAFEIAAASLGPTRSGDSRVKDEWPTGVSAPRAAGFAREG